jgi:transposase
MARGDLTDQQYARIEVHLPKRKGRGHPWKDHRIVLDGILWVLRTGAPWRDLPERYGPWQTAYDRFVRWQKDGTWGRILQALQAEADAQGTLGWECAIDASVVKAHQHAAGAPRTADAEAGGALKRPVYRRRARRPAPTKRWVAAEAG